MPADALLRDTRPVARSVDELLAGATERTPFAPPDGKSEVLMERVLIGGERHVVKHFHAGEDWIMRTTGDVACRPIVVWRSGLLDRVPDCIDHTVVGAAWDGSRGAILMRDVSQWFLPEGDHEIPLEQHLRFLDHMAELHATFWEADGPADLAPLGNRYLIFHHRLLPETEASIGGTAAVPTRFVPEGWARFPDCAPRAAAVVLQLHDDPSPLLRALAAEPQTLIHGDWKAGNLGSHPDGRTILVDWAFPGVAPPCAEIAWYVCLNRARLPHSKEEAFAAYRDALERHGIDTAEWWDRQLSVCLLGALVQFGWEKALGSDTDEGAAELAWWEERALEGAAVLG